MRIFKSLPKAIRYLKNIRSSGGTIGFVPTMGALHEGHRALIRASRKENAVTVVSIFVNPIQFGPKEDFRRYPRPLRKDNFLLQSENADIIICPSEKDMYPDGFQTLVNAGKLGERLCGRRRPGHFNGVLTVVCKLLNVVNPDCLYLGQKDAQQVVILKRMIIDLNYSIRVKVIPTVREKDGLAMSSRNQYLTERQRQEAPQLFLALRAAQKRILSGERRSGVITRLIHSRLKKFSSSDIEYVECVNARNLEVMKFLQGEVLIAAAVRFGGTRLIDNLMIRLT
jgi:pantoate--beta-alanine ligase